MYHAVVRRKVRAIFASITDGDYRPMLDGLGASFTYRFHGDHALGGVRTTRAAMTLWWERIFRILPAARFDVVEVLVSGGPWRTRLAIRLYVAGDLPGGERYENTVFQFMTLRWGKVTSIETMEDLQVLERALSAVVASGNAEAGAAPIADTQPGMG